jgi:hypothetical protein
MTAKTNFKMWGRHSCLPVPGTFQSPDSASNCQLWSAKLENFATGRLESPPYNGKFFNP